MQRPAYLGGFQTLRSRLLFWILVVVVPIYALATWLSYVTIATQLETNAERGAEQLAGRLAADLDAVITPIQGAIRTVARQLEETSPPRERYVEHLRGVLGAWPDVYGSTIAVEVAGPRDRPFAPYLFRGTDGIGQVDLARDSYGYRELPWYRETADRGEPVWSAPYFDRGGGEIWMVTYSVPFFRRSAGERMLAGVVTADLDLDWVRRTWANVELAPGSLGWLSSGSGEEEFVVPIGDTGQRLQALPAPLDAVAAREAGAAMLEAGRSFGAAPDSVGSAAYVAASNLGTVKWRLTLVTPRDALLEDARTQLRRQVELGAVGLVMLVVAIWLVAAGVARPIHALAVAVGSVGRSGTDNLHFNLPTRLREDEVGVLTRALARLRDSLQQHVQLRAESLAEQARLQQELEVSAQIQQSMLPHGDSIRSVPPGIEIAATLIPARHVGGDLYDYFPVPDGRLLFAIGDVSDKGIPAALFMARMSALMRVLGAGGTSPERVLGEINGRLAEGNDACMFVTVGCGLLDPRSGEFHYASAGHDPPLLRMVEGEVREVARDNGAAIGIDAGSDYPLQHGQLAPGDALLLYTDGLSEATDTAGNDLGIARVTALLRESPDARPAVLVARIVDMVANHAAGFRATDDLTVMALRFCPADITTRALPDGAGWLIAVQPAPEGLRQAQLRLRAILAARGIGGGLRHDVELVAEEWLTNVLKAAGNIPLEKVLLDVVLTSTTIQLTFRDDGVPFNPLEAGAPDLEQDVSDRPVGGLGLHLVREIAQSCSYVHADGCNVFSVVFARNPR